MRLVGYVQLLLTAVWSAVLIALALLVRLVTGSPRVPLAMARRLWAPGLLFTARVRLEIDGLDRVDFARAHLFAANHQSLIDIPVLFRVLPVPLRFVAKEGLRAVPFLGRYIAAMGMVYVRQDSRVKGVGAVAAVASILSRGDSVVTFPEGTRGIDGRVAPFKPGALAPAIQTGVAVVPVAIEGAGRVLPRECFRVRSGTIRVTVGAPVATTGLTLEDRADLARRVRSAVTSMLG